MMPSARERRAFARLLTGTSSSWAGKAPGDFRHCKKARSTKKDNERMKSPQEASGPRPDPDALIDMSCEPPAGFYQGKPDRKSPWRSLALRLLSPFVDLLLDCFTALLVEPDETPGVEVSTFAELGEAMILEEPV